MRGSSDSRRPRIERLESRLCLSSYVVSSLLDDGTAGTLRWAVAQVNANTIGSPDTIGFDPSLSGTITLTSGQLELGNNAPQNVTLQGPGGGQVTISGGGSSRILQIDSRVVAQISGLTMSGAGGAQPGGAIYDTGRLLVSSCVFSANSISSQTNLDTAVGGAIDNLSNGATVSDCVFSNNSADGGGAIYNTGGITIERCSFSSNTAHGVYYGGGAIANLFGWTQITDSSFVQNSTAEVGGAISNGSSSITGGSLTISGCMFTGNGPARSFNVIGGGAVFNAGTFTAGSSTFISNMTNGGVGGAICQNLNSLDVSIVGCTFSGNSANRGGAIYRISGGSFQPGASLTIRNSAFTVNTAVTGPNGAGIGGALYSDGVTLSLSANTFSQNSSSGIGGAIYAGGGMTAVNCTFNENSAGSGGGIYHNVNGSDNNPHIVLLINDTIVGDNAAFGGGIYSAFGAIDLGNTVVAGNTGSSPDISASVSSEGHNLIGAVDGNTGWVASDMTGTAASPRNPRLANLGNYGGPTQTMPPLFGSAVIDAGDNALITNPPFAGPPFTDQRGLPRIYGSAVDIGAVEAQPSLPRGDANHDGTVGIADVVLLTQNYGSANEPIWEGGDLNGDGVVNFADVLLLIQNYGRSAASISVSQPLNVVDLASKAHAAPPSKWPAKCSTHKGDSE